METIWQWQTLAPTEPKQAHSIWPFIIFRTLYLTNPAPKSSPLLPPSTCSVPSARLWLPPFWDPAPHSFSLLVAYVLFYYLNLGKM